jgi:hypothetical protein
MDLIELMTCVAGVFDDLSIQYFVTGSCASISYGEPRLTNDIDMVADIKPEVVESLLLRFPQEEFYISREAVKEAVTFRKQFNIIHPASGLKVDVIIRHSSRFDDSRFDRRRNLAVEGGRQVAFASPEDVIIKKLEYFKSGGSEKHLRDIAGMMKLSGQAIDTEYISAWARSLGVEEIWRAVLERIPPVK